ncbi:hypothetical protein EG329_011116 [Mollisiaceae sp. DMI_Dod_QoI]|nr:hypothetical protein EG329_011116 [Helotiales sp. DMI_Dod_QoI]
MAISLYDITIPVFIKNLQILKKLLEKGVAFTKEDGVAVTEESLAGAKLIADMGDLVYQIQRVSDTSKGLAQRVGGVEPVVLEDNEKTFPDMLTRIQKTIEVLEKVKGGSEQGMGEKLTSLTYCAQQKEDLDAAEDSEVVLKTRTSELKFTGKTYAINFAIPNFFFHFVTAYALLRKEGVQVGKADYLGRN